MADEAGEHKPPCPVSMQRCDRPACWDGCGYIGKWPPPACTGLTASWCPLHGDCNCPRHGDADNPATSEGMRGEVIEGRMDDDLCPLHGYRSGHPLDTHFGRSADA